MLVADTQSKFCNRVTLRGLGVGSPADLRESQIGQMTPNVLVARWGVVICRCMGEGDVMDAVVIFSNLVLELDFPMTGMGGRLHASHVRYHFPAAVAINFSIPGCSILLTCMS